MSAVSPTRPDILAFMTLARQRLSDPSLPPPKDIFHFSHPDQPALSDLLLSKAIQGRKTATTSWPVPDPMHWGVGDLSVILDGAGRPRALMRTTELKTCLFRYVEEGFALEEDEGTLEDYKRGHREFYGRQAEMEGKGRVFGDGEMVVCERFVVLFWIGVEEAEGLGELKG